MYIWWNECFNNINWFFVYWRIESKLKTPTDSTRCKNTNNWQKFCVDSSLSLTEKQHKRKKIYKTHTNTCNQWPRAFILFSCSEKWTMLIFYESIKDYILLLKRRRRRDEMRGNFHFGAFTKTSSRVRSHTQSHFFLRIKFDSRCRRLELS